ncbi:MAG: hypothetical protein U0165_01640 [Polyangiaceae bacterium]
MPVKPFGAHPLRAAIESGWPLLDGSAVVLRAGRLGRIRLEDGEVLESTPVLLKGEEDATCSAVRYGADVGFVCGSPLMGTNVYSLTQPLGLVSVARFAKPRAVYPSGNGTLVVRGPCDLEASGDPPAADQPRYYCVISQAGSRREVRTRGEAVERVVGLSDGRIAVVIPPRLPDNTAGQVTILSPTASNPSAIRLQIPEGDTSETLIQQGLWLDGIVESGEDELAAWIEAAGVMLGVRISLKDGSITVGKQRDSADTIVSGLLAYSVTGTDSALESIDGGQSWQPLDVPTLGQGKPALGRMCGVAGCVVPFDRGTWLRVGWGPPLVSNDFSAAPDVTSARGDYVSSRSYSYSCALSHVDPVPKAPPEPKPIEEPSYGRPYPYYPPGYPYPGAPSPSSDATQFTPFYLIAPPTKPKGFNAEQRDIVGMMGEGKLGSLYAWYPKTGGAEIVKNARLLARFVDRFDPGAAFHSSTISVPSWPDEERLKTALGIGDYAGVGFSTLSDPSGHAELLLGCSYRCDAYGVIDGRPIEMLPTPDDPNLFSQLQAPAGSAVRIDDAWYVARNVPGGTLVIWKLTMAEAKVLARVPRVSQPLDNARIVRRARGRGLGLLVSGVGLFGQSERELFVLPIDADSGSLGELVRLGPSDLGGTAPGRCAPEDDGWLIDTAFGANIGVRDLSARVTGVEMRLRIDPGHVCAEALSSRLVDMGETKPTPGKPGAPHHAPGHVATNVTAQSIPLVAIDSEGRRIVATCTK